MAARVVGIGGIFFKARDPETLRAWYRDHLGLDVTEWGGVTFEPSTAPFMINYRVEDLEQVVAGLRTEGCVVDEKVDSSEFGKLGWVMDPEGNRVELWEPPLP
jgi:catechol 2,3-dioxygenase-like lactoylglutathione lyase family enzyme